MKERTRTIKVNGEEMTVVRQWGKIHVAPEDHLALDAMAAARGLTIAGLLDQTLNDVVLPALTEFKTTFVAPEDGVVRRSGGSRKSSADPAKAAEREALRQAKAEAKAAKEAERLAARQAKLAEAEARAKARAEAEATRQAKREAELERLRALVAKGDANVPDAPAAG